VIDGQMDGQNCDGLDALKTIAAFARKNLAEMTALTSKNIL